jgi:hypothetical protein
VSRDAERFWGKVQKGTPDQCWPWTGYKIAKGYGRLCIQRGRRRKNGRTQGDMVLAHRFAWELSYGPPPADLFVCHKCDNRACCNPAHLFLGTNADNMADMVAKRRARPPRFFGEAHGQARLTDSQVAEIRRLRTIGLSQRSIAERIGAVSREQVRAILNGKSRTRPTGIEQRPPNAVAS